MLIHKSISFLKRAALLLFIVPLVGLIGSLLVHNYLVSYKYSYETIIPFKENSSRSTYELICSKENNMCSDLKKTSKLDKCNKFVIDERFFSKDGLVKLSSEDAIKKFDNKKPYMVKYTISDKLSRFCILNSKTYYLYKILMHSTLALTLCGWGRLESIFLPIV